MTTETISIDQNTEYGCVRRTNIDALKQRFTEGASEADLITEFSFTKVYVNQGLPQAAEAVLEIERADAKLFLMRGVEHCVFLVVAK